ncbi:DsbA family oxidoreductase [Solibacillus daqui]|uniref:DsbA family oxidoreductase n=1 Tax=Solibacillus daqui TaxID=2912187 RepID=UPI00236656E3|nr:DsbA family oxidoreductase [Solibacillus daqui]
MKIEIFSDFSCPFCYISKTKLFNAIQELGLQQQVEIEYKAYQLNPDASKTETRNYKEEMLQRFQGRQIKMQEAIDAVHAHANEVGLTYNVDAIKIANTENAHRLAKLAATFNVADAFTERVMNGYFSNGFDMNDTSALIDIIVSQGIPREQAQQVIDEQLFSEELAQDRYDAQQLQISSVPFMVFENAYGIKGVEPLEIYMKTLKQAQGIAKKRITVIESDAVCGNDGCEI